jgi:hypothetical protein
VKKQPHHTATVAPILRGQPMNRPTWSSVIHTVS